MNRPLREHFEVPTYVDVALRTFDYIEELEKYIEYLEALRQFDVSRRSEMLVNFLLHLNDKELINNHDFDYEKEAKKYLKKIN